MLCVPLTITYRYMCTGNNALGLAADNMRSIERFLSSYSSSFLTATDESLYRHRHR